MITEHFEVLIKQTYHTCKMYWKIHAGSTIFYLVMCVQVLYYTTKYKEIQSDK